MRKKVFNNPLLVGLMGYGYILSNEKFSVEQSKNQGYLRSFFKQFLDIILAKVSMANIVDFSNSRDWFCLTNSNNPSLQYNLTL